MLARPINTHTMSFGAAGGVLILLPLLPVLLRPELTPLVPLLLAAPAVLFVAWTFGWKPGSLATVGLLAAVLLRFQISGEGVFDPEILLPAGLFLLIGLESSFLMDLLHDRQRTLSHTRSERRYAEALKLGTWDIEARRQLEKHLAAQRDVARILAGAPPLREAAARILAVMGDRFGWELGVLWRVHADPSTLRSVELWHLPSIDVEALRSVTRDAALGRGEELSGQAWASGEPVWCDALAGMDTARAKAAAACGMRCALAFPLHYAGRIVGVLELYARTPQGHDDAETEQLRCIAEQLGLLIGGRRVRRMLRDTERYRLICESALVGMWMLDRDGRTLFANQRLADLLGVPVDELRSRAPKDLLPLAVDNPGTDSGTLNHRQARLELRYVRPDGDEVYLRIDLTPLLGASGERLGQLYMVIDMTEARRGDQARDRAIRAVSAERDRLEASARSATTGAESHRLLSEAGQALAASLDYQTTLVSTAHLALPGLADMCALHLLDDEGGIEAVETAHVDAERRRTWREAAARFDPQSDATSALARVLRSGWPELCPDPQPGALPFSAAAAADRDEEAMPHRSWIIVPLVARDRMMGAMTLAVERGRAPYESDDLALFEALAGRAALAIDNARLHHSLQIADRHKEEFLALLAHQLRDPLASVSNALYLLEEGGITGERAERLRAMVRRKHLHIRRLVDDLLDVNRIALGAIDLAPERVVLARIVDQALDSVQPLFEEKQIQVTIDVPATLALEADPARLEHVLSNLLDNAARYNRVGGQVWLSAAQVHDRVEVRVRDDGSGIDAALLPRLFDLYMSGERRYERGSSGLCIGLKLARSLVEAHGGTIEAHSDGPDRGAEVVVSLPIGNRRAQSAPDPGPSAQLPTQSSLEVLVVDDSEAQASTLSEILVSWGHRVQTVNSGPDAVRSALEHPPDVVFLDLALPGMSGYRVAQWLRAQPGLQKTVLVAVTGYGQDEDRAQARDAGFVHFLIKPAEPAALWKVLASVR